jgi:hypothetical protein
LTTNDWPIALLLIVHIRVIILSFIISVSALAQELHLSAQTDSSSYKIGEWVNVAVSANVPQGVTSVSPSAKDSIGPFEILRTDEVDRGKGAREWMFRLITFDSGSVFIPAIPFSYRVAGDSTPRVASTNPIFVQIHGVTIDPRGDIKDIKPPLEAPWKFEDFLPYLIAFLILAAACSAYWYYRKKKHQRQEAFVPAKPSIPPAQAALKALHLLEDKKLWQRGKVKEYYSEVTEIIRRFLEDQYRILAMESTSDEIMQQLKSLPDAQALLKQFRSLFTTADLVKFAKYHPTPTENEDELRWAYEIVRTMMQRIQQETEQEAEVTADVR